MMYGYICYLLKKITFFKTKSKQSNETSYELVLRQRWAAKVLHSETLHVP